MKQKICLEFVCNLLIWLLFCLYQEDNVYGQCVSQPLVGILSIILTDQAQNPCCVKEKVILITPGSDFPKITKSLWLKPCFVKILLGKIKDDKGLEEKMKQKWILKANGFCIFQELLGL